MPDMNDMCPGCGGPLDENGDCMGRDEGETTSGTIGVEEFDQTHARAMDRLREAKSFIVITLDDEGHYESACVTARRDLHAEMSFLNLAHHELERYTDQRLNSGDYGFGYYPLYSPEDADEMGEQ